jgi:hypothetical protein
VKYIKSINEFDTGTPFGDSYGYGGANGVFKINYKPFSDLSIEVGPDPNVPRSIKGSEFQVGDFVVAEPINSKSKKNKKIGIIVRAQKTPDAKGFRYFIQVFNIGKLTEKVIEVKPNAIQFVEQGDKGHQDLLSKYKIAQLPGKAFNSPTVYNDADLGLSTVGG